VYHLPTALIDLSVDSPPGVSSSFKTPGQYATPAQAADSHAAEAGVEINGHLREEKN
jgi:hypothetical protein